MMKAQQKKPRLLSLDVFRGVTIALMILVNSPGNSGAYRWLEHSNWNGCTLADLVFPFFIFIVGVSLVFTLSHSQAKGIPTSALIVKISKRSAMIFFIGLALNTFPNHFDLATIRIFGVLQRIALCYFFAGLLFLTTSIRSQCLIMLSLLVGYWLLMTKVGVPGFGANDLSIEGNLATWVDSHLFSSAHLYQKFFDPEGLVSTLPAVASALLGNITAACLLAPGPKLKQMVSLSLFALITGWLWGLSFPINKALWTSSYVLWTGGLALLSFAFCYWLIDMKGWIKGLKPFEIFGLNSMAAYILHVFLLKIQAMISITQADGSIIRLRYFITEQLFGWAPPKVASLLYALSYTLLCLLVISLFYH